MWQSSAKMLTDLGIKPECESLYKPGSSDYVSSYYSMRANVTDARGIARMGFCLPIECTQDDLNEFQTLANNFADFGISLLPKLGINIDNLVFNNQS